MPRLTPREQQEVMDCIKQNKPLPDKYRFLLFDDTREMELVWKGKNNRSCQTVLPFRCTELVDEPRTKGFASRYFSPHEVDAHGRQMRGWTNKLVGRASAASILLLIFLIAVCLIYFAVITRWEKEDR